MSTAKLNDTEKQVLEGVRSFLMKTDHYNRADMLTLDISIEDDLGIDSIGRIEMLRLLEKKFSLIIDDRKFLEAENIADIVHLVDSTAPFFTKSLQRIVKKFSMETESFIFLIMQILYCKR